MTYTINVSKNLTYCFAEDELRDIAEDVFANRSSIGQTETTIKTRCGFVQADRDDMYNINIYGEREDVLDADVFQTIATVTDDGIEFQALDMPEIEQEVAIGTDRYAVTQQAYYSNGYDKYQASGIDLSTGRSVQIYWNIAHPDAEEEADMCDWDNPVEAEEI